MARPKKTKRVCEYPQSQLFTPDGGASNEPVSLTVEEYEALRLIDYSGLSQEECSAFMQTARTTVQSIYAQARKKLAVMLVEARPLVIEGGSYCFCTGANEVCKKRGCSRQTLRLGDDFKKGDDIMRIAVTYENSQIFQHFGHTSSFKVYDVQDSRIVSSRVVDTNGSGHGALAGFLSSMGVDALICGGIGAGAQRALADAQIKLYAGVRGDADEAVAALLEGRLSFSENASCDHHERHGHGHNCSSGGCSEHNCSHE